MLVVFMQNLKMITKLFSMKLLFQIKNHFDQPGCKLYSNLEALLVKPTQKEKLDEEFKHEFLEG